MARCDQGYLCDVCGKDVENITDSDLYLRYILGEISPEVLTISQERHLCCNPAISQFIIDANFEPVYCPGLFDKRELDADFVREEEKRITQGWQRLQAIPTLGLPVTEYPLPEVRARWGA
ncbi:MAG: hypothetical protein JNJ77_15150 [Planctomycetia bacterium]|nr:hypothetical protein [Planctomycetia bacterium]